MKQIVGFKTYKIDNAVVASGPVDSFCNHFERTFDVDGMTYTEELETKVYEPTETVATDATEDDKSAEEIEEEKAKTWASGTEADSDAKDASDKAKNDAVEEEPVDEVPVKVDEAPTAEPKKPVDIVTAPESVKEVTDDQNSGSETQGMTETILKDQAALEIAQLEAKIAKLEMTGSKQ